MYSVLSTPSGSTRKPSSAANLQSIPLTIKATGFPVAFFSKLNFQYTPGSSVQLVAGAGFVIAALVIAHGAHGEIPGNGVIEQQSTYR